jgi:hypothetical protein
LLQQTGHAKFSFLNFNAFFRVSRLLSVAFGERYPVPSRRKWFACLLKFGACKGILVRGGKHMAANESYELHPLWVRLAIRKGTKRSVALSIVFSIVILTGGALLSVVSELGNLGLLALVVGLACVAVGAACAVWTWFAVRWVDRNGAWPQAPD